MKERRIQTNVFFFSSRRRHTRYWRDWSSDVCFSDLRAYATTRDDRADRADCRGEDATDCSRVRLRPCVDRPAGGLWRLEERRVGEECRSRWSPYLLKKKKNNTLIQRSLINFSQNYSL